MRLLSGLVSATSTWCSLGRKRCLTTRVGGPVAATTAELQQWFEAGGGLIHRNVVLATKQTQPEVRTIGAVAKGEQLMSCPLTLALGFESPWDDKSAEEQLQRLASACVPQDMWQLHLGLRLLRERIQGESSKWHKYISALPLLYTGVPLFFKKKGFESIIYPPLATQVNRRLKALVATAAHVQSHPEDFPEPVNADVLGWGMSAVSSRAFEFGDDIASKALVPVFDLMNHSFEPNAAVVGVHDGCIVLEAAQDIEADTELRFDYGPRPNDQLLLDYGFIVPDNPHDTVMVRLGPGFLDLVALLVQQSGDLESDGVAPWKLELLGPLGFVSEDHTVTLSASGAISQDLSYVARVLCALTQDELQSPLIAEARPRYASCLVSLITALMARCIPNAQARSTSIMDDVKELQHLQGDLHLTKEMLLGKKVIFARAANKLLESAKTPGLKPN